MVLTVEIDDLELIGIAKSCQFKTDPDVENFGKILLKNSGCLDSAAVFIAGLDPNNYKNMPHKTQALLEYWIQGAPPPSFTRSREELRTVLEKARLHHVIREYKDYFYGSQQNQGESTPTTRRDEPQASMRVLKSTDKELFRIAEECVFTQEELEEFAQNLLEGSGAKKGGAAFLNQFDARVHTPAYQTRKLFIYWIDSAPGPDFTRSKKELQDALAAANKATVILNFKAYFDGDSAAEVDRPRSPSCVKKSDDGSAAPAQSSSSVQQEKGKMFSANEKQCPGSQAHDSNSEGHNPTANVPLKSSLFTQEFLCDHPWVVLITLLVVVIAVFLSFAGFSS